MYHHQQAQDETEDMHMHISIIIMRPAAIRLMMRSSLFKMCLLYLRFGICQGKKLKKQWKYIDNIRLFSFSP